MIRIEVDQDRARALGISSQQLSSAINAMLSGTTITQLRDATYLIDIVARAVAGERATIETLRNLTIATPAGGHVPLAQIATASFELEPPLIWRRQRLPTVTVQADVSPGLEAETVIRQLAKPIEEFRRNCPRLCRRRRRRHRGQRQEPGEHCCRRAAHAVPDGHHPDDPAHELPAPRPCIPDRAPGAHWRLPRPFSSPAPPWDLSPFSASFR